MSSFIDLLSDHVWSDDDIVNRTEAMIASAFPRARVDILNRKLEAQSLGRYTLTPEEQQQLDAYALVCFQAGAAADAARADMALLQAALDVEAATRRLAQPPADPPTEQDGYERQAAAAVLEAITPEVQALLDARAAARAPAQAEEPAP